MKRSSASRIRSVARVLRWLAVAGLVGTILATAWEWSGTASQYSLAPGVWVHLASSAGAVADPALARRLDLLPAAAIIYALFRLMQMMAVCERGDFLSFEVPRHLQGFSAAIVAFQLLDISLPLQVAVAQALSGRHGSAELVITGGQVALLVLALLFVALAWVLQESSLMADDHARIV